MTPRSRARAVALQLLFGQDHNPQPQRTEIERFVRERLREPSLREFSLALYDGVPQPYGEIFAMRADGSDVRQLTDNKWEDASAAMAPEK